LKYELAHQELMHNSD